MFPDSIYNVLPHGYLELFVAFALENDFTDTLSQRLDVRQQHVGHFRDPAACLEKKLDHQGKLWPRCVAVGSP